LGKFAFAKVLD